METWGATNNTSPGEMKRKRERDEEEEEEGKVIEHLTLRLRL